MKSVRMLTNGKANANLPHSAGRLSAAVNLDLDFDEAYSMGGLQQPNSVAILLTIYDH